MLEKQLGDSGPECFMKGPALKGTATAEAK